MTGNDLMFRAMQHGWKLFDAYDGGWYLTHRCTLWGIRILCDTPIDGNGTIERI